LGKKRVAKGTKGLKIKKEEIILQGLRRREKPKKKPTRVTGGPSGVIRFPKQMRVNTVFKGVTRGTYYQRQRVTARKANNLKSLTRKSMNAPSTKSMVAGKPENMFAVVKK